jgi:hypothetical protein
MRDVRAIVTERGAGCDGRCGVRRVHSRRAKRSQRTAKSCGPGAATLASIRPACAGLATVARKAVHRGEHEISRKAIARGKPGCLGCTCQTRVHSSTTNRTRRCGRSRRPAFPAPSVQGGSNELAKTQANPRCENASACLSTSSRGASATTRLRLLRKLRRAWRPPKRLGAKAEAIHLSPRGQVDCFASFAMTAERVRATPAPPRAKTPPPPACRYAARA